MTETNESLLARLKASGDDAAWDEFYQLYWQPIVRYARKLGLGEHEAHDVLQETLVTLVRLLPRFTYDPRRGRFRNYLLTIVHRRCLAWRRRNRREEPLAGAGDRSGHREATTNENGAHAAEARWRESLLETALANLRDRPGVDRRTLAVFSAYVLDGRPARAVAAEFAMNENAVYQIKNRLLARLRQEVARLERETRL